MEYFIKENSIKIIFLFSKTKIFHNDSLVYTFNQNMLNSRVFNFIIDNTEFVIIRLKNNIMNVNNKLLIRNKTILFSNFTNFDNNISKILDEIKLSDENLMSRIKAGKLKYYLYLIKLFYGSILFNDPIASLAMIVTFIVLLIINLHNFISFFIYFFIVIVGLSIIIIPISIIHFDYVKKYIKNIYFKNKKIIFNLTNASSGQS